MSKPIMEFKDEKQLEECLKYWQNKLFLNDWTLKAVLVKPNSLGEGKTAGQNEFQIVNRCALIRIATGDKNSRDCMQKLCHEGILIHELLHCKYNWVEREYKSIEAVYYDELEHGLLEQMAKSLLMTKYNLDFDWFAN